MIKTAHTKKNVKPKRAIKKVLASMRQVVRVHHVAEVESIWTWGESKTSFLPNRLRVCVWNMWKQAGGELFAEEFKMLSEGVDLFLAQEALLSRSGITLFAQPGFDVVHAATYRRLDGCRDGVMTMSKSKTCQSPIRVISATTEPLLKTTKAALITHYRIGHDTGPVLAVANIHSTLMRSPKTAGLEIKRIIEHLEDHVGPVIFAGDFNTISRAYFREMSQALNLLDIKHAAPELEMRAPLARLDQVFVRGLKVKWVRIDASVKHSDHFPLLCEFFSE